jgi:hypothetical protein
LGFNKKGCLAHEFGVKPFVKAKVIMFVKAPLKPKKAIEVVLY